MRTEPVNILYHTPNRQHPRQRPNETQPENANNDMDVVWHSSLIAGMARVVKLTRQSGHNSYMRWHQRVTALHDRQVSLLPICRAEPVLSRPVTRATEAVPPDEIRPAQGAGADQDRERDGRGHGDGQPDDEVSREVAVHCVNRQTGTDPRQENEQGDGAAAASGHGAVGFGLRRHMLH